MSKSRFKVSGSFNGVYEASVVIDRGSGVMTVRPSRRRTTYELPLSTVAEIVMWRIIKAEAAAKLKAKREKKKLREILSR